MATQKTYNFKLTGTEKSLKEIEDINRALVATDQDLVKVEDNNAFKKLANDAVAAEKRLVGLNKEAVKQADASKKLGESFQGAFTVLQTSSTAAFGEVSESLTKAQGLAGGLVSSFDGVKKVVEGLSTENLKMFSGLVDGFKRSALGATLFGNATRAALTATGIGIFLVALGAIAANWEDIAESIGLTTKQLDRQIEQAERLRELSKDYNAEKLREEQLSLKISQIRGENAVNLATQELVIAKQQLEIAKEQGRILGEELDFKNRNDKLQQEDLDREKEAIKLIQTRNDEVLLAEEKLQAAITQRLDETDKKEKEDAKKRAEELKAIDRQIIDLRLANLEDGLRKEQLIIRERYRREIEDVQGTEKQKTEQIKLLTEARFKELDAVRKKYNEQELKKEFEDVKKGLQVVSIPSQEQIKKSLQAAIATRNAELEKSQANTPKVRSVFDIIFGTNTEGLSDEEREENVRALVQASLNVIQSSIDFLFTSLSANIRDLEEDLDQLTQDYDRRVAQVDETRQQLAQAEGDRSARLIEQLKQQEQAEQELYNKKVSLERQLQKEKQRQAKLRKAADIGQAIAGTALGVVGALGNRPWTPANFVLAALVGAAGAVQVATIAKQQYARGGVLEGPSHSQGGIKTPFGELEGGEAVINKRSTAKYKPILSAINVAEGGRPFFETGGQLATPDFAGIPQQNQGINANQMAEMIGNLNVQVAVTDINDVNSKLDTINVRVDY